MNETVNIRKVSNEKISKVLEKSWYIIGGFIILFGAPMLAAAYLYGASFWGIYIRFWAMAGMIFGFMIGIPTGMVISIKLLFRKTEV